MGYVAAAFQLSIPHCPLLETLLGKATCCLWAKIILTEPLAQFMDYGNAVFEGDKKQEPLLCEAKTRNLKVLVTSECKIVAAGQKQRSKSGKCPK